MTDYKGSREWAKTQPTKYLACRGRTRHLWTETDRYIVPMGVDEYGNHYGGYYLITERCPEPAGCGMHREREMDYFGEFFWTSDPYKTVEGYLSRVGRIDPAACRAEEISRYEVPTLITKRPPHRTGYTPIPATKARRRA